MSDTPLSHVGSSGARLADECVQSRWDRFAMSDLSDDRASRRSPWVITGRTTTQPLRLKKSSWKMHQEHAADSDMVEAN
jgi:hypothetical protein